MRKKYNRLLCLLLAACIAFAGCTTGEGGDASDPDAPNVLAPAGDLSIPYSSSAGFNPYLTANSLTHQTAHLLFCRLITIDPSFNVEYNLAARVDINGVYVTIFIEPWQYADGSAITPQDVAASILAATQSAGYAAALAGIEAVDVSGPDTVSITLREPDSMFAYLLDMPIIKQSELGNRAPTASGRYYVGTGEAGDPALIVNPYFHDADNMPAPAISLIELGRQDTLIGSLNIGDISFYASEQEAESSTSIANKTAYYKMNNLVFLGFNGTGNSVFTNAQLRVAVSLAINRSTLCEKAYFSRAYVATGALNPTYPVAVGAGGLSAISDTAAASEMLTAAGYTTNTENAYLQGPNGAALTVRLLCPPGSAGKNYTANLIKEQLARVGIGVTIIETESTDAYLQILAAGNFDMYIGEIKLYNNMDLSPFFAAEGAANYGISISPQLLAAYNAMRADDTATADFEAAFAAEIPFAPLVYRCGTFSYNRALAGVNPSHSDLFYQFENLHKE
ncbi:ABC transporter substrate-binding protein [Ruminococcaceae bacterium OttesenSCG-928-N02]|nr:ABC transporter substrate-binding protein [Ruminococcaceae bacterium OttesenSCG-928-N02]